MNCGGGGSVYPFPRGELNCQAVCTPDAAVHLAHVPGVRVAGTYLQFGLDMVPLLAGREDVRITRVPEPVTSLPGADRYRKLGLAGVCRPYQVEAVAFAAPKRAAMICDPMQCLGGEAEVIVNRAGCARRMPLRELVRKFNGEETRGRRWDPRIPTRIPSFDGQCVVSNEVAAAHSAGVKKGFELTTASGARIVASAEHRFLTLEGDYVTLDSLQAGDWILRRAKKTRAKPETPIPNPYRVMGVVNHPHARRYGNGANHVYKHRLIYEAHVLNGMDLSSFVSQVRSGRLIDLDFLDPAMHVHHKNGDPTDNRPSNLEALSQRDHSREHARESYRNVLFGGVEDRIRSIRACGDVEMFDLTMADPYNNYIANDFIVHNSGKSLSALAAAVAAGYGRVLILTTTFIALNWAEQVNQFLGEEALFLTGRGLGGRYLCPDCATPFAGCRSCRYTGTKPIHDVTPATLESFRYVVCSYDCLRPHEGTLPGDGRRFTRTDLPGRALDLHESGFDLVILDEAQLVAGDSKRALWTRQAIGHRPAVYVVTGTPVRSFARDIYGLVDLATNGGFGNRKEFERRYCEGHYDEHGWRANGRSPLVDAELAFRLPQLMIKRERSVILPQMPEKQRKVVRIDPPTHWRKRSKIGDDDWHQKPNVTTMKTAALEAYEVSSPVAIGDVLATLGEGGKAILYTWHKDTARRSALELQSRIKRRDGAHLRARGAEVFLLEGLTPTARNRAARSYREHKGAAVAVSTMEAAMMGVPLSGTWTIHYIDLHWDPYVLEQSEDRSSQKGSRGVVIIYYIVRGSVHERIIELVLPKLKTQRKVHGSDQADSIAAEFTTNETLDEAWARHTAHLRKRKEARSGSE